MPKTISIIEDNIELAEFISVVLSNQGWQTKIFSNGLDALKDFKTNLPDLIILDINLPAQDGFQILDTLKLQQETKNIPVIICSERTKIKDVDLGMEKGAAGYILKPFELERLINKIKEVLK